MTMPACQNCQHQGDGWCLACVGKLAEESSRVTGELIRANAEIASLRQAVSHGMLERDALVALVRAMDLRQDAPEPHEYATAEVWDAYSDLARSIDEARAALAGLGVIVNGP